MSHRFLRMGLAAGLWALSPAFGLAQEPPATAAPAPPAEAQNPVPTTEYQVGPGDVLQVTVFGNEDISRAPTIQPNGTIALPLVGDVAVTGLTLPEIQRKLTALLAKDFLVNPQVEVKVKEYQSQFVSVVGEVNSPGRKPLRGRTRLFDVLIESGGFTPRASGEVVINRRQGTFDTGSNTMKLHFSGASPSPRDLVNIEVLLHNGDLITASAKYYVTVEGEVARPGRYPLEDEMTVSGAVTSAGGLTRFGKNDVKIRRIDAASGETKILDADLKSIRNGKDPDFVLLPNDVITVPRKLF
jgi:polysaccharide export outer membrane protein